MSMVATAISSVLMPLSNQDMPATRPRETPSPKMQRKAVAIATGSGAAARAIPDRASQSGALFALDRARLLRGFDDGVRRIVRPRTEYLHRADLPRRNGFRTLRLRGAGEPGAAVDYRPCDAGLHRVFLSGVFFGLPGLAHHAGTYGRRFSGVGTIALKVKQRI